MRKLTSARASLEAPENGTRFGRCVVIGIERVANRRDMLMRCDCGREFLARLCDLVRGRTVCCRDCIDWDAIRKKSLESAKRSAALTPEDIARRTAEVRDSWSDEERERRLAVSSGPWVPPVVSDCRHGGDANGSC